MIWFPKEKSRRKQILGDPLNEAFAWRRLSQTEIFWLKKFHWENLLCWTGELLTKCCKFQGRIWGNLSSLVGSSPVEVKKCDATVVQPAVSFGPCFLCLRYVTMGNIFTVLLRINSLILAKMLTRTYFSLRSYRLRKPYRKNVPSINLNKQTNKPLSILWGRYPFNYL